MLPKWLVGFHAALSFPFRFKVKLIPGPNRRGKGNRLTNHCLGSFSFLYQNGEMLFHVPRFPSFHSGSNCRVQVSAVQGNSADGERPVTEHQGNWEESPHARGKQVLFTLLLHPISQDNDLSRYFPGKVKMTVPQSLRTHK